MSKGTWIALVIALLLLTVGAVFYWYGEREPQAPAFPEQTEVPEGAESPEDASGRVEYPVPTPSPSPAEAPTEPLPGLEQSDAAARQMLEQAFGAPPVEAFLIPNRIIRHIVVTVDSLDRDPVRLKQRPVAHVTGAMAVEKVGDKLYLSSENAERYDAYISSLEAADAEQLVGAYLRYYPLFQRAYEELGYPDRYFNDRLIAIIDHLLAGPDIVGPIEVLRPKVLYTFADPKLEALSWGHKSLIRVGPANAAIIKRKLTQIRALIVERTGRD